MSIEAEVEDLNDVFEETEKDTVKENRRQYMWSLGARRILSYGIDFWIILPLPFTVLEFVGYPLLVRIAPFDIWIGLAWCMLYGLLASFSVGGQTIGMRLTRIRITKSDGTEAGWVSMFWRWIVMFLILKYLDVSMSFEFMDPPIDAVSDPLSILIFGASSFFFLFLQIAFLINIVRLAWGRRSDSLVQDGLAGVKFTLHNIDPSGNYSARVVRAMGGIAITIVLLPIFLGFAFVGYLVLKDISPMFDGHFDVFKTDEQVEGETIPERNSSANKSSDDIEDLLEEKISRMHGVRDVMVFQSPLHKGDSDPEELYISVDVYPMLNAPQSYEKFQLEVAHLVLNQDNIPHEIPIDIWIEPTIDFIIKQFMWSDSSFVNETKSIAEWEAAIRASERQSSLAE